MLGPVLVPWGTHTIQVLATAAVKSETGSGTFRGRCKVWTRLNIENEFFYYSLVGHDCYRMNRSAMRSVRSVVNLNRGVHLWGSPSTGSCLMAAGS